MFFIPLHSTAMPLSPAVLQTGWTDGADLFISNSHTLFLSVRRTLQTAWNCRNREAFKMIYNLAWFFRVPGELNENPNSGMLISTTGRCPEYDTCSPDKQNRITSDRERHRVTNDYVTPVRAKYKHLSSLNVWFMQTLALWSAVTKSGCCSVWEQRADSCSHRQQFRECHCPLGISAKFGCTETSLRPAAECVIDAY